MPTRQAQKRSVETHQQLAPEQRGALLRTLRARFEKHMNRHHGLRWPAVQARLEANPENLWSLHEMERTGGEPDVVGHDKKTGEYVFHDCSAESPKGRVVCVTTGKRWRRERNTSRRIARRIWRPPCGLRSSRKRSIASCRR